ncbi:MAG: glycosyltransferase [Thermotogaceae bacterium]|nr:glycosyltransferase [Thermotogaceae bacterium]
MESSAPLVSVIIPTRNEETTVQRTITDLLDGEYKNIELIIVDGMSSDSTIEKVSELIERYDARGRIKLMKNEKRYTTAGLNLGISSATGKYIMIASAHATYSKNYISECVDALENEECDVAGGVLEVLPRSQKLTAIAIAEVLKHPFGIGGATYRVGVEEKTYVDTVAYGVYRREIFDKIGMFDERLIRNQDIEFNLRLQRAGYRIMCIPQAVAYYYARDSYSKLWANNFSNGFWVTYSRKFVKGAYSLRHLVPLFFILYLISLIICLCLPISIAYKTIWLFPAVLYASLDVIFSTNIAGEKKKMRLAPGIFLAFFILHISYGMGSLYGVLKALFK